MKQYPSIFNDVIGPVMVGPSSSHTAASVRIGNILRQLIMTEGPYSVIFRFDKESSLATTYNTQGVDVGLAAGLAGLQTHQKEVMNGLKIAEDLGIKITFKVEDIGPGHPNTYHITLMSEDGKVLHLKALSTGGGMIEIIEFEGFPLSITGGFYEILFITDIPLEKEKKSALEKFPGMEITEISGTKDILYQIKSESPIKEISVLSNFNIYTLTPVLPIASQFEPNVPFITAMEAMKFNRNNLSLWELACKYESIRSGMNEDEVLNRMIDLIDVLYNSLDKHNDEDVPGRILQSQSQYIRDKSLLGGSFQKEIIYHITRFMEIKSGGGVFVAAPTAGSCGCLAGTVFALAKEYGLNRIDMAKCMLAAGLVGVFIAYGSTFSAEVCGCQAECGAGSGMCAAACSYVLGLNVERSFAAASMALQNIFGMVCDPVANRVEVPCLGKNIMASMNGIACANMAAAGFSQVIPLDETISAMDAVGKALPMELRCTGLGGLSMTPTAQRLKKE